MIKELILLFCAISMVEPKTSNSNDSILFSVPQKKEQFSYPEECYGYERALEDVGVFTANKLTGKGVNIGFIESGIPTSFEYCAPDQYEYYGSIKNDHAKSVSSIAGGKKGIANDSKLFFACLEEFETYNDCLEWLVVDKKCNIVNVSRHIGASNSYGDYDYYNAVTDYYSNKYNVLFVCSNGNKDKAPYTSCPATSLNSISVAASNALREKAIININGNNLKEEYVDLLFGPNIYAPGYNVLGTPYFDLNDETVFSGTSCSAPFVSGIAALLMEEFPSLKENIPGLVSVIMCSGNNLSNQNNICEKEQGFGLVNYEQARKAALNLITLKKGNTTIEKRLFLRKKSKIRVVADYFVEGDNSDFAKINGAEVKKYDFSFSLKNLTTGQIINASAKSNFRFIDYLCTSEGEYSLIVNSSGEREIACSYYLEEEHPFVTVGQTYLDSCPTIQFNDDINSTEKRYDLYFMNYKGDIIVAKTNLSCTSYTLTKNEWNSLIDLRGREFYTYFIVKCNGKSIPSTPKVLYEPVDYKNKIQIKPSEWGFDGQYYYESDRKHLEESKLIKKGFEINSRRLRCGYIENSYIVLSPIRKNAGKAYLELTFSTPIYSYMFGITTWGTQESIYSGKYSGYVEEMDMNGVWSKSLDLINDIHLSNNFYHVDRYSSFTKQSGIYGLRFIVFGPATGDRNKGRICLDDIVLSPDYNNRNFLSSFYESIGGAIL